MKDITLILNPMDLEGYLRFKVARSTYPVHITLEDLKKLTKGAEHPYCSVSAHPLGTFNQAKLSKLNPYQRYLASKFQFSLDRINSKDIYRPGNVACMSVFYNTLKGSLDLELLPEAVAFARRSLLNRDGSVDPQAVTYLNTTYKLSMNRVYHSLMDLELLLAWWENVSKTL